MPWKEVDAVSLREEFVTLALQEGTNVRELCRRFEVSPKTGYKWIARYERGGKAALTDASRRPNRSPRRTATEVERTVEKVRRQHPAWGGRKICARLKALKSPAVPAPSTITEILRRRGMLDAREGIKHQAHTRFEYPAPNQLWQMDFKGHFPIGGGRCHPLTVLDDHSRFAIGLQACANEQEETTRDRLIAIFRRYGLPEQILADNGSPWGAGDGGEETALTVWLWRLGVGLIHGRPHHPQTQGKDERFHRTLNAELLRYETFRNLGHCQIRFDCWRDLYNLARPHEALGMAVPASRYQPSPRAYPEVLPPIEYGPGDQIRIVEDGARIRIKKHGYYIGKGFRGLPVALRATTTDGLVDVVFCQHTIARVDLRSRTCTRIHPAARSATAGSDGPALRSPRETGQKEP